MNVHYRLALLGLVAGLIACAALYLAWTARRRAAAERSNQDGRDADLLAAIRALEKGNRALDRDLDTLVGAWVAAGNPDPFAPEGHSAPLGPPQEAPTPPVGHTDTPQAVPEAPRAAPPERPTPFPRTQTYAAVQPPVPAPNPADIPTEAAPTIQQQRNSGAHRATGR